MPRIAPWPTSCIECGFCEPRCPSRELTLSPRQRIVVARELARLRALDGRRGHGDCGPSLERRLRVRGPRDLRRRLDVPDRVPGRDRHRRPGEGAEGGPPLALGERLAEVAADRFALTVRAGPRGLGLVAVARALRLGALDLGGAPRRAVTGVAARDGAHRSCRGSAAGHGSAAAAPAPAPRPARRGTARRRPRRVFPELPHAHPGAQPGETGPSTALAVDVLAWAGSTVGLSRRDRGPLLRHAVREQGLHGGRRAWPRRGRRRRSGRRPAKAATRW